MKDQKSRRVSVIILCWMCLYVMQRDGMGGDFCEDQTSLRWESDRSDINWSVKEVKVNYMWQRSKLFPLDHPRTVGWPNQPFCQNLCRNSKYRVKILPQANIKNSCLVIRAPQLSYPYCLIPPPPLDTRAWKIVKHAYWCPPPYRHIHASHPGLLTE